MSRTSLVASPPSLATRREEPVDQLILDLGVQPEAALTVPLQARQRQDVVALMADAILAVVETKEEDDEPYPAQ